MFPAKALLKFCSASKCQTKTTVVKFCQMSGVLQWSSSNGFQHLAQPEKTIKNSSTYFGVCQFHASYCKLLQRHCSSIRKIENNSSEKNGAEELKTLPLNDLKGSSEKTEKSEKESSSTVKAADAAKDSSKSDQVSDVQTSVEPTSKAKQITSKVMAAKRERVKFDPSYRSTERNFITAIRAMNEYLLKPSDLEGLRKTFRRSPYENAPPIAVYLRKDIEAKALEVWGSYEALSRELRRREEQEREHREFFSNADIFQIKQTARYFQDLRKRETSENDRKREAIFGSRRVVYTAVCINAANCTLKFIAWMYTGSHSMFSEVIHSLADTVNQLILAYGIHKSIQAADSDHPYGYSNVRYVASLISGVGIFCFGTGLSLYHGIVGLLHPTPVEALPWALFILGGSLISEGATLLLAINAVRRGAKQSQMTFREYVLRAQDPSVNVVLLEDVAAVLGVGVAAVCMSLAYLSDSHIPDAIGSILIGGILGAVASFIISTNSAALVGRSIPPHKLHKINQELEDDVMIRAIHDAKCIDMGSALVRYKAEIDFDGRELTRSYLDKQNLELLLDEMQNFKTIEEVESFMLKHGENVIDLVGAEIDRIETQLKKAHPEIRHCDLEVL